MSELALLDPRFLPNTLKNAPELRRLKVKHRRVLALHLQGVQGTDIARTLGHSPEFVYNTINSSLGQEFLNRAYEQVDIEIRALMPKAVATLSRNMECGDPQAETRAAVEALKLNKKYDDAGDHGSIEDVIERVVERIDVDGQRLRVSERQIVKRLVNVGSNREDYNDDYE